MYTKWGNSNGVPKFWLQWGDIMEPIVFFKDSGFTQSVIIEPTDFTAFSTVNSGGHIQTVGSGESAETFTGHGSSPFSPNYGMYPDGTTFGRNMPTVAASQYLDTVFYIKPNMKIAVYFGVDPDNINRLKTDIDYYVGETLLTSFSLSRFDSPIDTALYSLHVGAFKIDNKIEIGFYLRTSDRTLVIATVSENFWNGTYEIPKYVSDIPKATAGHQPQGNIHKGTEQFVDYCFALNKANAHAHGPRIYVLPTTPATAAVTIESLYEQLWSTDMWTQWKSIKYNLFGGLLSWHMLPCIVPDTNTSIAKITINGQGYHLGNGFVKPAMTDKVKVEFASDLIPELFGGFLDYGTNVSAVLYLPFCGQVQIDPDKIMGGHVEVTYYIDVYSGNCLAEVRTIDRENSQIIYGQYTGNCAYKMPLSGSDSGGAAILGTLVSNAGNLVGASVSGNPMQAAAGVFGSYLSAPVHTAQIGSFSGNAAALGDLRVKLVLTRPAFVTPETLASLEGFSAASDGTVTQYETEGKKTFLLGDISTDGIAGTDIECDMIRAAFQKGVFV